MKQFSVDKVMSLLLGDFKELKYIPKVPYKHQCYENFYYGKDLLWENEELVSVSNSDDNDGPENTISGNQKYNYELENVSRNL
jgi:hypothetical protein